MREDRVIPGWPLSLPVDHEMGSGGSFGNYLDNSLSRARRVRRAAGQRALGDFRGYQGGRVPGYPK
jgi:hypothetical protein